MALGVGCFSQERGGGRQEKRLFYFGDFSRYSPGGAGRRLYTPPVHPCTLQRTRTDCTRQAAGQTAPNARRRPRKARHTPGRWTRCTGLNSIPDRTRRADHTGGGRLGAGRVRNCADSDRAHRRENVNTKKCVMLHTQLDIDTKKCYYNARNKRTLKSVTPPQKEDKNHENKKNHAGY